MFSNLYVHLIFRYPKGVDNISILSKIIGTHTRRINMDKYTLVITEKILPKLIILKFQSKSLKAPKNRDKII